MKSKSALYKADTNSLYSIDEFSVVKIISGLGISELNSDISFHDCIDIGKAYLNYEITEIPNGILIEGVPLKAKIEPKTEILRLSSQTLLKYDNILSLIDLALSRPPIQVVSELRGMEKFEYILSLKAKDGNRYLPLNEFGLNYGIYLHPTLLPVAKKDNVSLEIFDYDNSSFLARFVIQKTKTLSITVIVRCLKI